MRTSTVTDHPRCVQFFHRYEWFFAVLHRPTFMCEVERFLQMYETGRRYEIDPAWLSLLFSVSLLACLSASGHGADMLRIRSSHSAEMNQPGALIPAAPTPIKNWPNMAYHCMQRRFASTSCRTRAERHKFGLFSKSQVPRSSPSMIATLIPRTDRVVLARRAVTLFACVSWSIPLPRVRPKAKARRRDITLISSRSLR